MVSRRHFLAQVAAMAPAFAARVGSYDHEMPDMLVAYLASRLDKLSADWDTKRTQIRTTAEIEARNTFVRKKMRFMLGAFPERCPLGAETTRTSSRDGYRIENVLFQSRPAFWVTANLYIPATGSGPFPAIVSPCGHYDSARMYPDYQFAYIDLARSGFVVLAYDPIGQGERREFWNPETNLTEAKLRPVYEHSMAGQLLLLFGESLAGYFVWDAMRAIDYLFSRPEVDRTRIGCTGHSGGGTATMFLSAADERVRCAVINEGGAFHRWPVDPNKIGPSDAEQSLFPAAIYGIDVCDVEAAIAPRALLLLTEEYTPEFNLTAAHIAERYRQLGAPEKFKTEEAADDHAWTMKLRLATADWFSRWFYGRPGPQLEPDLTPESQQTLRCTPDGSLRSSGRGNTIFGLIRKKAEAARFSLAPDPGGEIRSLIRYRAICTPLSVRNLADTPRKGYRIERVEFLSEPGVYIPVSVFVPEQAATEPPLLYLDEAGKDSKSRELGLLEKVVLRGQPVIAVDVRGIGVTRIQRGGCYDAPFGHLFSAETAAAYMAWYLDDSLFGMRVLDTIRSVDYALSRPDGGARIKVVGKGMGGLWALFAAALDPRITAVVCDGSLATYRDLALVDRYLHPASIFIEGILCRFDLPQVACALSARSLALLNPVDAMKRRLPAAAAESRYEPAIAAFQLAGGRLRILETDSDETAFQL